MTRTFKTEVIVLKKRNLLGKDLIITIFSRDRGKLKVFAKGIKKITSRRLSHIETGNLVEVLIYSKSERLYLQESKLISLFSQVKKDRQKLNQLYFILFILDRILPENQKELPVYNIFLKFIIALSKNKKQEKEILSNYLNKILQLLGYTTEALPFAKSLTILEEIISEKIPYFII